MYVYAHHITAPSDFLLCGRKRQVRHRVTWWFYEVEKNMFK